MLASVLLTPVIGAFPYVRHPPPTSADTAQNGTYARWPS